MGSKQGVRGALLEAAGLSLPAVPCRAQPPRPSYYSLLQQNSSRLNEKSFPGGEAEISCYQLHVQLQDHCQKREWSTRPTPLAALQ